MQPSGLELRLASIHLRTGLLALARAELETSAGRGELDDAALLDLAEVRWRTDDVTGAGEAAAAYFGTGREDTLALVIATEATASLGRSTEARRLAQRALARGDVALDTIFRGIHPSSYWPAVGPMAGEPAGTLFGGPRPGSTAGTPGVTGAAVLGRLAADGGAPRRRLARSRPASLRQVRRARCHSAMTAGRRIGAPPRRCGPTPKSCPRTGVAPGAPGVACRIRRTSSTRPATTCGPGAWRRRRSAWRSSCASPRPSRPPSSTCSPASTGRPWSWSGATPCGSSATSATRATRMPPPRRSSSGSLVRRRMTSRVPPSHPRARLRYCSAAAPTNLEGDRLRDRTYPRPDQARRRPAPARRPDPGPLRGARPEARRPQARPGRPGPGRAPLRRPPRQALLRRAWSTSSPPGRSSRWPSRGPTRSP